MFPHRAQSVYLRRKSDQFFQIVYYHGDIILHIIYNIQDKIISSCYYIISENCRSKNLIQIMNKLGLCKYQLRQNGENRY